MTRKGVLIVVYPKIVAYPAFEAVISRRRENMKDSTKDKSLENQEWMLEAEKRRRESWLRCAKLPNVFWEVGPVSWKSSLFIGPVGSGKSYMAAQMVRSLFNKDTVPVLWVNIPNLLYDIRRGFDSKNSDDKLEAIFFNDYVVLDDLGAEHTTDWVTETIYIIVNHFWENQKNLIVTSNLQPSEIAERFGDRLMSRILDICEVKYIDSKDRRSGGN